VQISAFQVTDSVTPSEPRPIPLHTHHKDSQQTRPHHDAEPLYLPHTVHISYAIIQRDNTQYCRFNYVPLFPILVFL